MASQIFNHRDPDTVLDEIISAFQAMQPDVAVNEASTLYLLFQVFAFVTAQNNDLALQFAEAAFITTATDIDLTNLAADRGITRKAADKAQVILEFSRAVSDATTVTIPASSSFSTLLDTDGNSIIFKTFTAATIAASTTSVTGLAEAQTSGLVGNVAPDTVVTVVSSIAGLDTVTNVEEGFGGTDEETDDALRERVIDFLQNNTGRITVTGYKQTLESFNGVASALVVPGSGAMPNYITAVVTTDATVDGIPTAGQLAEWSALVNSDDNRAVVDVITVIAPTAVPISVTATINTYDPSADPASTLTRVATALGAYINSLSPGDTVRVVDLSNVIHDDAGVIDFTMTVPAANTVLANTQKATIGTISIT